MDDTKTVTQRAKAVNHSRVRAEALTQRKGEKLFASSQKRSGDYSSARISFMPAAMSLHTCSMEEGFCQAGIKPSVNMPSQRVV